MNILITEDNEDINNLLSLHLTKEGYTVFQAFDGLEGLQLFNKEEIDLMILDVMMPKIDGFNLLTKIRETSEIPVILLTARSEDADKVLGLGLGADDYVVKPFSVIEIISRVQAQLRRYIKYSSKESKDILTNGSISLDLTNYIVKKKDILINLNPKEFKLLSVFMKHLGSIYTKEQLYEIVWEELYHGDSNTIMVHMSHLREKIEDDPKNPKYLKTIRGIGYRMEKVNE
ncbi:response regulator transcription factor [Crassaminicella profunda]|uniref:response regulator transcription factor n=1 Tax=Crassaminicella profunda TaxID=1286698 RepID=UPI001CA6A11A|nr:response regulator transcription factor [Crassaminicella profunda]QZY57510.1 response regulator transcription factor [Crassaminicella profunda]